MIDLRQGDCLDLLREMPDESVQCCVTSPPYFGLRDYGVGGQLGLESTPDDYVAKMVEVFREVRRVLRDDGTLWLNLGDSYGKGKQLQGIPWRVAFALQADGWILRQDIIWHKPCVMPESVRDRCTKSHEYIFLLSKSKKYYYDSDAVKEPATSKPHAMGNKTKPRKGMGGLANIGNPNRIVGLDGKRNRRSVWTVAPKPFKGAHFATFPPDLIEPCILAGCPKGGTVLDPFGGSGTVGMVAKKHGRDAVLIELNPEYVEIARQRCGF